MSRPEHATADDPIESIVRGVVTAPVDPWTYRSLAYLLVTIPLALVYFVVLTTGVALTLGLSFTLAGPIAFVATLLAVVSLARLDAVVTGGILEASASPGFPDAEDGLLGFLEGLVLGRETWFGGVYLAWKVLLGFVAFAGLVAGVSLAASLLAAPLYYGEHVFVAGYRIDTLERALFATAAGVGVGYATLALANVAGRLSAAVAEGLLTEG